MTLSLFGGHGIELEYMIVDSSSLDILPVSDKILHSMIGDYHDFEKEGISWSNELVLHVLELKTSLPSPSLVGLEALFQSDIILINKLLSSMNGRLLPTAMHPWMNPKDEMHLWPHGSREIYSAFHRIFNCTGHGWANLQSAHLNLPFATEEEFEKLHASIRLVLPIIPAIAASSPIIEGKSSGIKDTRLNVYRTNSRNIFSISGHVVPEVCRTFKDYHEKIFNRMYADIAPYDPEGILQEEWLNARGAITRFDRNAIEIRVIDVQESPVADLAIAALITAVVKALVEQRWVKIEHLHSFAEEELAKILFDCMKRGEDTIIKNKEFLKVFGINKGQLKASQVWEHLVDSTLGKKSPFYVTLFKILSHGTLSTRILKALGHRYTHERLHRVYHHLAENLANGTLFLP